MRGQVRDNHGLAQDGSSEGGDKCSDCRYILKVSFENTRRFDRYRDPGRKEGLPGPRKRSGPGKMALGRCKGVWEGSKGLGEAFWGQSVLVKRAIFGNEPCSRGEAGSGQSRGVAVDAGLQVSTVPQACRKDQGPAPLLQAMLWTA